MRTILLITSLFYTGLILGQDSVVTKQKWFINGYIKNLESFSFDKNFQNNISDNLIHNRVNIKWKPVDNLILTAEFRNRLFWGETVKTTPDLAEQLHNKDEMFDLSITWIQKASLLCITNAERLNIEYRQKRWNLKVGRQRINWGITTTWNPNDIFNTYNFLDFDYEERPGVDGARGQYVFNNSCNAEIAWSGTGKKDENKGAVKLNLNKSGYDMQFIAGWYKTRPTLGLGWAGNINDAGFKGEVQYIAGRKDSADHINGTLEASYMFKKGWYLSGGMLYNKTGLIDPIGNWNTDNLNISPENLMPTRWNLILTTSKEMTPLLSVNVSSIYAPGTKLMILLPSLKYNLASNLDVDLVWQSFFTEVDSRFEAVNHRAFLRMKWSF